ncbi:hypothetical protein IC617_08710 [Neiella sp. HB171785]|uniref:Uncharacterized protein n=1 Tax=Neiella litorisoli TaxID=2771431 RepID=A0A8J6UPU5_9GAMM|nr:hypothetical protein [Neiella litorisoli]MBD1389507.1 hypothetical protein [Neiella litorisoli]
MTDQKIMSIKGNARQLASKPNEIPLIYMNEANQFGVTEWLTSESELHLAQQRALEMGKGVFDGAIAVGITDDNSIMFFVVR